MITIMKDFARNIAPGAVPPPPGIEANVDDPPNELRNTWIVSLSIITFFPILIVLLRFYVKLAITRPSKLADAACLLGFVRITKHIWSPQPRAHFPTKAHFHRTRVSRLQHVELGHWKQCVECDPSDVFEMCRGRNLYLIFTMISPLTLDST
jgi:hypothetical protein